jgi:23S rRNA (pseudouridine1915-N3)-methyltransferase
LLRHTGNNPDCRPSVSNKPSVQIRIVAVGKLKEKYAVQACAEFAKRLAPYYSLDIVEVKASDGSQPAQAMREEAERIAKQLHTDDCVWLLDRTGGELSSEQLSRMMSAIANAGTRRMALVIAGTYGADDSLRERADFVWSLSQLTFLHEWARMIVLEQLYRAAKIARNEPYHH